MVLHLLAYGQIVLHLLYCMAKLKKIIIFVYILLVVVMGYATFYEKSHCIADAHDVIYGSQWFAVLWALLASTSIIYIVRVRMRRWYLLLLHFAFVVILCGAWLTKTFSYTGTMHLRQGKASNTFVITGSDKKQETRNLPFYVRLDTFKVINHEGTEAVADYQSHITLYADNDTVAAFVAMNKIKIYKGVRLYQSAYDSDQKGCTLAINSDSYGIAVTYVGYALLFVSLLWLLIAPNGTFRQSLKSPLIRKAFAVVAMLLVGAYGNAENLPHTFPKPLAEKFGRVYVNYNNRICPMQTLAIDFTKKLCGKATYKGYTAEQVLLGFVFWGNDWSNEPIIKIKNGELKTTLQLPNYCSANDFFKLGNTYRLASYVEELYQGNSDSFHKQAGEIDDRLQLILQLRQGKLLKVFPFRTVQGNIKWYAPTDKLPNSVDSLHSRYINELFSVINTDVLVDNYAHVEELVTGLRKFQVINGGASIPSLAQTRAERVYNSIPFTTILFVFNLTLGLLLLAWVVYCLSRKQQADKSEYEDNTMIKSQTQRGSRLVNRLSLIFMSLSFVCLTLLLVLRWKISGTIPLSNGYETMLVVAWFVQLLAIFTQHKAPIVVLFGYLLSGFFLLVSHIAQMDPAITHIMPVLNSPLLSLHVSVIMMSYALLSLTFVCGISAIVLYLAGINKQRRQQESVPNSYSLQIAALQVLSHIFLYPALVTLSIGIFVGAIWANVSWGQYWSWDPKEVWALITLMVYAVVVHHRSLRPLNGAMCYHLFIVLAFLTVLMTYFGVNYILGGMHSYA